MTWPSEVNKAALVNPFCTSCSAIRRLSNFAKAGPENWIMSTSMRAAPTLSTSDSISVAGSSCKIHRAVDQIDAQNAQGLLLRQVFLVPQPDVNDDLRRFLAGLGLKANAQPAMGVVLARITARHHRVGERRKTGSLRRAFRVRRSSSKPYSWSSMVSSRWRLT